MSDKKQNRHKPKKLGPVLTPEQQAAALAAAEARKEELKAERERIELYGKSVENMSYRQLRSELAKVIRRERVKTGAKTYEPIPGLNVTFGTVFLTVLENTRVEAGPGVPHNWVNQAAKLACYLR